MPSFQIHGGKPLSGSISTSYSKNAATAILAACLMTKDQTILHNVPKIEEMYRFEEVFTSLGIGFEWKNERDLIITPPQTLDLENLNKEAAKKTRSIIYFMGALSHKYKDFTLPPSGGCKLGKRTNSPHEYGLEKLGITIEQTEQGDQIKNNGLIGSYIVMYESGDTATNNVIMASVLAKGNTVIKMASANYMVQDLCFFLNKMGAHIKGIGTTTLEIEGVEELHGVEYPIMHDPIESMFWLSLAATTKAELLIKACPRDFIELELLKLEKMGFEHEVSKSYKSTNGEFDLIDIQTYPSELTALEEKIYCRPFPGLNMDNLPFFVPIAASAKGKTLIHDWPYENRAIYFVEIQKLGAEVFLMDTHRIIVEGPTIWKPTELVCPPALRPATMLVIPMLAAEGTSIIRNTYPIDRGYENLKERLCGLGADITNIE